VFLTGGNTARFFYSKIADSFVPSAALSHTNFYIGDERCVLPSHPDSNYSMIMRVLFGGRLPKNAFFHRMEAEAPDLDGASDRYSQIIPNSIDMMLLSMGEDGHIASLFPGSPALNETERKVMPVVGPKAPFQRLTITPPVIQSAKQVYVLAIGDEKRRKYEEALFDPEDISSIPARLVLDRTWIFDLEEEIDLCPKL